MGGFTRAEEQKENQGRGNTVNRLSRAGGLGKTEQFHSAAARDGEAERGLCNALKAVGLSESIYLNNDETGKICEQEFGTISKFLPKTNLAVSRLS